MRSRRSACASGSCVTASVARQTGGCHRPRKRHDCEHVWRFETKVQYRIYGFDSSFVPPSRLKVRLRPHIRSTARLDCALHHFRRYSSNERTILTQDKPRLLADRTSRLVLTPCLRRALQVCGG